MRVAVSADGEAAKRAQKPMLRVRFASDPGSIASSSSNLGDRERFLSIVRWDLQEDLAGLQGIAWRTRKGWQDVVALPNYPIRTG